MAIKGEHLVAVGSFAKVKPLIARTDYKNLTHLLPVGFGDAWLRFNGIGEKRARTR